MNCGGKKKKKRLFWQVIIFVSCFRILACARNVDACGTQSSQLPVRQRRRVNGTRGRSEDKKNNQSAKFGEHESPSEKREKRSEKGGWEEGKRRPPEKSQRAMSARHSKEPLEPRCAATSGAAYKVCSHQQDAQVLQVAPMPTWTHRYIRILRIPMWKHYLFKTSSSHWRIWSCQSTTGVSFA
jgi:hypothetical protein